MYRKFLLYLKHACKCKKSPTHLELVSKHFLIGLLSHTRSKVVPAVAVLTLVVVVLINVLVLVVVQLHVVVLVITRKWGRS